MRASVALLILLAVVLVGCVPPPDSAPAPAPLEDAPAEESTKISIEAPPAEGPGEDAPATPEPERPGAAEVPEPMPAPDAKEEAPRAAVPQGGTSSAPLAIAVQNDTAETHPDAPVHDSESKEGQKVARRVTEAEGTGLPGTDLSAKVTPVKGEARFLVEGAFDLTGTIILPDPEAEEWVFEGSVTFPHEGYKTGEVFLSSATTEMPSEEPDGPTQVVDVVIITLPVYIPGAQDEIKGDAYQVPFKMTIPASAATRFAIVFSAA